MADTTAAYYLAGFDPLLLGPLLEDLAQRYLTKNELSPVLYHAEDAQRLQRSLDTGLLRYLNTNFSYRNSGRLPPLDIHRVSELLSDPASSGLSTRRDQATWIVLNSLHSLPPANSANFAGYLSRQMPALQQVDVLLHGHPGKESGEVVLSEGNRRNRIITAPQIASTLGRLGIEEEHMVALQACHSADTDHSTSSTTSAVGDATAQTFGAALRRAFDTQPGNPRIVTARHGWGIYGPADRRSHGADLPRSEERSLTGPSWAHEQLYAPWMRTTEDAYVGTQLQVMPAASFQAVYPSGPGAIRHARTLPELPMPRIPPTQHFEMQTDPVGMADRLTPTVDPLPQGPTKPTARATRRTQTDASLLLDLPAGIERQTQTDMAMPAPEFVYPAPYQPVATGVVVPRPTQGAAVATADAGVQTAFTTRDIGSQAGLPPPAPDAGMGAPPSMAAVQTQTATTTTRPAIVQTTVTYFDPASRVPAAVYPFHGPGEVGLQTNLDGTHPAVH